MGAETHPGHGPEQKDILFGTYTAWAYAGQGTQTVGMGRELARASRFARRTYQKADRILRFPISEISFNGPKELLDQTTNTQPAIFVFNYVCGKLLERQNPDLRQKKMVAGHSLGEYNALVTAGALSFKDALWLVGERAKAMKKACDINPGGMIAIPLRENDERLLKIMERFGLEKAIINSHEQTVLAGPLKKLEEAKTWGEEQGIKGKRLDVEGAPHTSQMDPAVDPFSKALDQVTIKPARIPIVGNTTATPIQTPQEIREELLNQLTHTVLWKDTLVLMTRNGIGQTIEVGEKGILSNMNLKVNGGKVERLKNYIREKEAAVHFVIWRRNPQAAPQLA